MSIIQYEKYVNSFWYFLGASVYFKLSGPFFCRLTAKNLQSIQSSTKTESENGQLKKGSHDSSEDIKTSFKSNLAQEGPGMSTDEYFISEKFENNVESPQQVRVC